MPKGVPYGLYDINILYVKDTGLRPIGGSSVKHVRISKERQVKKVTFAISSVGFKPQIPDSRPQNKNEVLIHHQIEFAEPFKSDELGIPQYAVVGMYVYSLKEIVDEDTGFELPFPPYYRGNLKIRFTEADFIKGYH